MSTRHDDHSHGADGGHEAHPGTHGGPALSERAKRGLAIQELLVEKGVVSQDDIQSKADAVTDRSPADGARVVARAWVDPGFKQRLLADATGAVSELGYDISTTLQALENTEEVHHLVVCTLCSCYPWALLGPPPDWYKSFAYRSRAVVEPRAVMGEFGLEVDEDVEVRVVDSTADLRYLVLPRRPSGTQDLSEEELAGLVTRDSMVGVGEAVSP